MVDFAPYIIFEVCCVLCILYYCIHYVENAYDYYVAATVSFLSNQAMILIFVTFNII